jgi:hypothetical protein
VPWRSSRRFHPRLSRQGLSALSPCRAEGGQRPSSLAMPPPPAGRGFSSTPRRRRRPRRGERARACSGPLVLLSAPLGSSLASSRTKILSWSVPRTRMLTSVHTFTHRGAKEGGGCVVRRMRVPTCPVCPCACASRRANHELLLHLGAGLVPLLPQNHLEPDARLGQHVLPHLQHLLA